MTDRPTTARPSATPRQGARLILAAGLLVAVVTGESRATGDPAGPGPPRRLTAGAAIETAIGSGLTQAFEIQLTQGDYLSVVLDQRDFDLMTSVTGPDGALLSRINFAEWGREEAAMLAPATGLYRLVVTAAPGSSPTGTFRIEVGAIRPATPADAARARAFGLASQAYAALRPSAAPDGARVEPDRKKAGALFEQAAADFRAQGDRGAEALALDALAFVANEQDDFRGQAEYSRRSAEAARAAGDESGEARALGSRGMALDILGDSEQARPLYMQSLAMHRAAGRTLAEARMHNSLANSYGAAGDVEGALSEAYQGLEPARRAGDVKLEARMLSTIARAHLGLGEYQKTIDTCRHLLALASVEPQVEARANGLIGMAHAGLGERDEARRLLEESLAFWNKQNWRGYQAGILTALGELALDESHLDEAAARFESAAAAAGATGLIAAESAARRRRAETLIRLGRLDEAQKEIDAATKLDAPGVNLNVRALNRSIEARVAMARGDLAAARKHAEAAVDLSESARGRASSARIRSALLATDQSVYETLVDVLMAQHERSPAAGYDARALETSERARARSFLESMLGRRRDAPAAGDPIEEMRALQRRLNAKAEALDGARRGGNAERIAQLTLDIDEIADAFTLLDTRVRSARSPAAAVVAPAPLTASAIRAQVLDKNTVLLEYLLTDAAGYAWVVTKDRVTSHRLAGRDTVEAAATAYQAAVSRPPAGARRRTAPVDEAAAKLSALLLGPIKEVAADRRLLIVAPAALQQIPFAALPLPGSTARMVDRFEIVQAPSASIVAAARQAGAARPPADRSVVVFADPVFESQDARVARAPVPSPADEESYLLRALRDMTGGGERAGLARLPFSREEADAIAALAPPGSVRVALGFDASLAAVNDPALAEYRIVHFATHGLLDTRIPELSGLVFSLVDAAGAPQEGYLRLHDVDRLRLNADLAVLSGCETALGRSIEGEGVLGLTRGFMLAGARGVVASLWKVDDLATAEMMRHFYRGLLVERLAPPAALRQAQAKMAASDRWQDPYFWAGFVVQGEWR